MIEDNVNLYTSGNFGIITKTLKMHKKPSLYLSELTKIYFFAPLLYTTKVCLVYTSPVNILDQ